MDGNQASSATTGAGPRRRRAAVMTACLLLGSFGTSFSALAGEAEGPASAAHHLRTADVGFGDDARIRERQTGLSAWSPERGLDRTLFRVGFDYAYTRFAFEGLPTRARDLHHLYLPLAWRDREDRWLVVAAPVVATSSNVFKDFLDRGTSDDVDLHLRLQLQRWHRPDFGWQVALVRDSVFGRPRFHPAASLLWRSPSVQAMLGLPMSRIDWQVRRDLALGAALFPAGGSWHVVSDERGGAAFDYRARAWRAALTADWRPWRALRASAQAGVAFRRHYRFEDDTGALIDRDAGSAPYWRVALQWDWRY
jgi:hypothetical protein